MPASGVIGFASLFIWPHSLFSPFSYTTSWKKTREGLLMYNYWTVDSRNIQSVFFYCSWLLFGVLLVCMTQDSDWGYPSRFCLGIKPLLSPTAALYTTQGLGNLWFAVAVLKMVFPGGSAVKNLHAVQETTVRSLGQKDPLEKEMAIHSTILAWRIPCTEEPGGLQSMGSQKSWARLSD